MSFWWVTDACTPDSDWCGIPAIPPSMFQRWVFGTPRTSGSWPSRNCRMWRSGCIARFRGIQWRVWPGSPPNRIRVRIAPGQLPVPQPRRSGTQHQELWEPMLSAGLIRFSSIISIFYYRLWITISIEAITFIKFNVFEKRYTSIWNIFFQKN